MKVLLLALALAAPEPEASVLPSLSDYFAGGPFRPAQRLVARGETRAAVAALRRLLAAHPEAPERPQAQYLLGLSLIEVGAHEEAARLFGQLASSYPVLADEHRYQRGRALFAWQSYLDAARALEAVDPKGPRGPAARRLRALALDRATAFAPLARWLDDEDARRPLPPELRLVFARARHRTGDVLGAYRSYRRVWLEAPEAEDMARALVGMAGLSIGDKPLVSRAAARVVGDLERALTREGEDLDPVLDLAERRLAARGEDPALQAEIAFARGRRAASRGRVVTALDHLERAARVAPADAVQVRAKVGLARGRALERLGRSTAALDRYERVAERFSDRPEAEEALFRASELQLRSRRYRAARARCEALLLSNPVTEYRRQCLWSIGWGHYRLGEYTRAREFFGALAKMELPAELDAASRYWLARTDAQLDRLEAARRGFLDVLRRDPLGYYAALAEAQLVEPTRPAIDADRPAEPARGLPPELVQAREYARLGLARSALDVSRRYEAEQKRHARRIPEVAFHALAELYDELGQRAEARRVRQEGAREHPAALGDAAFVAAARWSLPVEYEAEIGEAALEHDVPEPLLFALVRTESGFRADAVSAMNAYGLAQLILPTARTVSARLGLGRATRTRLLTDPRFNVRLGAAYLRELLDHFEGSTPLALASYNAGPEAVTAWMSRRVRRIEGVSGRGLGVLPSADELAEEIPVEETRRFVKAVLARARGYALLYGRALEETADREPAPATSGPVSEPAELAPPWPASDDRPKGLHVRVESLRLESDRTIRDASGRP